MVILEQYLTPSKTKITHLLYIALALCTHHYCLRLIQVKEQQTHCSPCGRSYPVSYLLHLRRQDGSNGLQVMVMFKKKKIKYEARLNYNPHVKLLHMHINLPSVWVYRSPQRKKYCRGPILAYWPRKLSAHEFVLKRKNKNK